MAGPPPGADGFPDTVPEIVASLDQDPILIEQIMGNGHTRELHDFLTAKEQHATYPVYVVYTATPPGLSGIDADEELASLVHAGVRKDGVYVVHTSEGTGHVGVWGDLDPSENDDEMLIGLAHSTVEDQITAVVKTLGGEEVQPGHPIEAAAALEVAAHTSIPDYSEPILSDAQLTGYANEMWSSDHWPYTYPGDEPQLASPGLLALVATTTLLVALVVSYRLLQAVAGRGGAPVTTSRAAGGRPHDEARLPTSSRAERVTRDLDQHRARATDELARLERSLADAKLRLRAGAERADLASHSHETGIELLDSDDPLDLIGAAVLARIGSRALDRTDRGVYRCCYINPLHGEGSHERPVAGGLSVPVCPRCDKTMRQHRELDALVEDRRLAIDGPYYEGDTVWAETGYGALVDDLWRHVGEVDR
ncbi:hypothetical protein [Nocardioides jensenii]|uniref:hypothetical protein n=1 Tax=Nocardioides jensenii TaxID=1843 RepID=UPI00082F7C2D|nr:hypothetical protein [Nocardioides jensenii]